MNVAPATLTVTAPNAVGVNVAVYVVPEVCGNALIEPFVTVTSPDTKSLDDPLKVNFNFYESVLLDYQKLHSYLENLF